ncbi:MAG: CAF17-like 4Fe-4S cluster assembly/insertion protein YgfZ [Solirubrobacterales bacterium]
MSAPAAIELDAQYRQLREECALLDRSRRGRLAVRGPEAAEYLQGQVTNDVEGLKPGEGCYAALLDRKGHVQADLRVLRTGADEFLLDTEEEGLEEARRHLQTYNIGREAEVTDETMESAILSLIGPRSAEVAGMVRGETHDCEAAEIAGVGCLAITTDDGLDLACNAADRDALAAALVERGAGEIGEAAAEIARIEAGVARFGAEITPATMPAEAHIVEAAVSFTKGCYIGQETVARLHYRGRPNRHLRGLRFDAPAAKGDSLRLGEREVGVVGSACVSPALGPIGLAILRREAEPGATLALAGGDNNAEVVELPFAVGA